MKTFFLFFLFLLFGYNLYAQIEELIGAKYEMEILRKNGDTTFVKVTSIKDKRIVSEESLFLIPQKAKQPRYLPLPLFNADIRLPLFYKKSFRVWSRKQGLSIIYREDGRSFVTEYKDNQIKHQTFFYNNSEITEADYYKMNKRPFYVRGVGALPWIPFEIVYDGKNYSIKDANRNVYPQVGQ